MPELDAESLELWRATFSRSIRGYMPPGFPTIVCLCGSTRFGKEFAEANLRETMVGKIVLSIGCNLRTDTEIFDGMSANKQEAIKRQLDELHFRKVELADEILVLNVGGYVGQSTRNEIAHATKRGKVIRYLEPLETR